MLSRILHRSVLAATAILGLLLLVQPASVLAQQTGTVEGTVLAATSQRPLAGAQVSIEGTGLGSLVQSSGTFTISNVPAGDHTVRVTMLGYAPTERDLTVGPGETVTIEFALTSQALALDEVVVTGTAGGTQRRAIGNVVDRLDASGVMEVTPVTSVNQLIGQRSPGVQIQPATGQVGAGAPIHIRGVSSLSLGSTPLIYIDGVRMDSRHNQGPAARGGAPVSRLDDLNPEDIESI